MKFNEFKEFEEFNEFKEYTYICFSRSGYPQELRSAPYFP
jgi:hypothetical protein